MIVRPAPEEHYPWIAQKAELIVGPAFKAIEAVDDYGKILGMVGLEVGMPNAVSLHIAMLPGEAIPRSLRRQAMHQLIKTAFGIVFNGYKRDIAVATVLSSNLPSRKLVERLGFQRTGSVPDAWGKGVDLDFYVMRREACRWLEA